MNKRELLKASRIALKDANSTNEHLRFLLQEHIDFLAPYARPEVPRKWNAYPLNSGACPYSALKPDDQFAVRIGNPAIADHTQFEWLYNWNHLPEEDR